MRVDTQYVALVSHVCAATTKGDSPLEEMYKEGVRIVQNQISAVALSWMLLAALRAAHGLLVIEIWQVLANPVTY